MERIAAQHKYCGFHTYKSSSSVLSVLTTVDVPYRDLYLNGAMSLTYCRTPCISARKHAKIKELDLLMSLNRSALNVCRVRKDLCSNKSIGKERQTLDVEKNFRFKSSKSVEKSRSFVK